MATAKMVLGMLAHVERPALTTTVPTMEGKVAILMDCGANVNSTPQNLLQFALMGKIYGCNALGISDPRVGLLSVSREDSTGSQLVLDTISLLKIADLNYCGTISGDDLFSGRADVAICDGFVGNVILKTSEGLVKLTNASLRASLASSLASKAGAMLNRTVYSSLRKQLDYTEYGGAPLLGIRGISVIGHGASNAKAVMNGIRMTASLAHVGLTETVASAVARRSSNDQSASR